MDSMPPEALLDGYPPAIAAIGERLRAIVMRAVPEAIERVRPGWRIVGYDLPVGRRSVYFCWIMPEPRHIHLGFVQGVAMQDPERILRGAGITKLARWVTLRPGDEPDAPRLIALIREGVRIAGLSREERMLLSLDREAHHRPERAAAADDLEGADDFDGH